MTYETRSTPKGRIASAAGLVPVALSLLVLTASASQGGWVLWEESGELQSFQRTAAPHPRSHYTNLEDCVQAVDAEVPAAWITSDGHALQGWSRFTPTSAIVMVRDGHTNTTHIFTYTCLPDTLHPPEKK